MALKDKIIAFDIDGTLARNDSFPSKFTCETIASLVNDGYQIVLVTGRSIVSSIDIYNKCHLNTIAVLCNGALVYDPIKDYKYRNITIPFDVVFDLINNDSLMALIEDILIEIDNDTYALTGKGWPNAKYIGDFKETLKEQPNAMVLMVKDPINQASLANMINLKNANYHYRYWAKIGEYYSVNFSKKEGVEELLKIYHKTKDDLIFFGDGENDKELLSFAGLGIAMKNALDDTKKVASLVTDLTNEEDGAIKYLLDMIAKEQKK